MPERARGGTESGTHDSHARTEHFLRRREWRESVAGTGWLIALAGIWLVVSPLIISYGDGDASFVVPLIGGAIIFILAVIWSVSAQEGVAIAAGLVAVGAGLAILGGSIGESALAEWNLRITGAGIVLLSFAGAAASSSGYQRRSRAPSPNDRPSQRLG